MSKESDRRISQASRKATAAIAGYTEDDITWAETRTLALMLTGTPFVAAVYQASQECSQRIFDRQLRALTDLENYRDQQRDEARAKRESEEAVRRSALEARATLGQRPTLKTSFGDLLAAKKR